VLKVLSAFHEDKFCHCLKTVSCHSIVKASGQVDV